ncbi:MAG TPA: site-specific integrase [Ferruginibacter sp.]|nr:site-specific integrase [Ferruginibacter sp.]
MPRQPEVHFRLKPEDQNGRHTIYLQFIYSGHRLFYSFGQTVRLKDWNTAKERVKNKQATTSDGKYALNDLLDNLHALCIKTYNGSLKTGIPAPGQIKKVLEDFVNQNHDDQTDNPTLYKLAQRFIDGEIKNKGKDKSRGSISNYKAVTKHLREFESKTRYRLTFETINLDFFYKYTSFLKDKLKLAPNTIAKDISILKVFMSEAVDLGYTANMQFRHKKFAFHEVDTDHVYLTDEELHDLYNFDLSHHKKLEQVKDLFIFGAWVGLRFSDFSNIKPENIVKIEGDYFIKIITQKTKDLVIIPCNPVVLEIFEKYKSNANRLPKTISNQKFNDYIKDVCKLAGTSDVKPVKEMMEKGRLSTNPGQELWQSISSHTARRSFATNYYLQGFPTLDLMKITGHKTERAFLKYIRVSKLDTAKRLAAHIKLNWSKKILKIA